jgi:hypothetical protein
MSAPDGGAPRGTGEGGRITPADIRAKAQQVAGGAQSQIRSVRPALNYAALAAGVVVVALAFWLGRHSGRRRSTIVEIRRG